MMRMYVGHGFAWESCNKSSMRNSPTEPPRTLIILPAYCSGCWYKSQRVASTGFAAFCPQQNLQPANRRTQPYVARIIVFIAVLLLRERSLSIVTVCHWKHIEVC